MKFLIIAVTIMSIAAPAQGIYKWRDSEGKLHFSDKKPENYDVSTVGIFKNGAGYDASTSADEQEEETTTDQIPATENISTASGIEQSAPQLEKQEENPKVIRVEAPDKTGLEKLRVQLVSYHRSLSGLNRADLVITSNKWKSIEVRPSRICAVSRSEEIICGEGLNIIHAKSGDTITVEFGKSETRLVRYFVKD